MIFVFVFNFNVSFQVSSLLNVVCKRKKRLHKCSLCPSKLQLIGNLLFYKWNIFIKKAYIPYPSFCTIKIIFQILLLYELHSFAVLYHLSYETFSNERDMILININLFCYSLSRALVRLFSLKPHFQERKLICGHCVWTMMWRQ